MMSSNSPPEGRPAGSPHVVLLVEDEPVLRASMVRGLSKLPGIEVLDAGTVKDAKVLMSAYPPALIISDLDLPDGSGVEIAAEVDRAGTRVPVVFVTAYLNRYRARLPDHAGIEVHEKPIALDRLRHMVLTKLGAIEADAQPFSVLDYVQLAGLGRRSVVLDVRGHVAGTGRIVVRQGEIWSAYDEMGQGLEAFRRLAFLRNAHVSCKTLASSDESPRNIEGNYENILLEIAQQFDESRRDTASWRPSSPAAPEFALRPPPTHQRTHSGTQLHAADPLEAGWDDVVPAPQKSAVQPAVKSLSFEELYDLGVDALLAKRHSEAYRHFEAASRIRPNDPSVVANLKRLRDMGHAA